MQEQGLAAGEGKGGDGAAKKKKQQSGAAKKKHNQTKQKGVVSEEEAEASGEEAEASGEEVYEVEKVVRMKGAVGNEMFLIKWKNYGEKENTWQTKKDLRGEACECFQIYAWEVNLLAFPAISPHSNLDKWPRLSR